MNIIKQEKLNYNINSLEPYISSETIKFHFEKHHKNYVDNANKLIQENNIKFTSIEELIKNSNKNIFNNVAQAWNHDFYWKCLSPERSKLNNLSLNTIKKNFDNINNFKEKFFQSAVKLFGSGWTWAVINNKKEIEIINTSNANNPITNDKYPILVCDLWEHAYYIDYRNVRIKYINSFWKIINWNYVNKKIEENLTKN